MWVWPRPPHLLPPPEGPEWRSSLLGLQGRTACREHWELLGFHRKGVQASASPLSSWTLTHTTPPRTCPWPGLTPPPRKEVPGTGHSITPGCLLISWVCGQLNQTASQASRPVLDSCGEAARLLNPGWQKPLVWGGGPIHPFSVQPHTQGLCPGMALLSALLFPGFPTG